MAHAKYTCVDLHKEINVIDHLKTPQIDQMDRILM